MRIIKQITELIDKSLCSAECYIQKSLQWKEEYPVLSRALYEASLNEMDHVSSLHDSVTKIIQTYKDKKGEPPEAMKAVYDYLHEKEVERANEIRVLQNSYRSA